MKDIIIIVLLILNAGIIFYGLYILRSYLKNLEIRKQREYMTSLDISDDKIQLLDKIIDIEFETYIKMHPDKFEITGTSYIKETEFQSIISEITTKVYERLTPTIIENILLTYVIKSEDDMIRLIGTKVGFNLALAASEVNTAMVEDNTVINI